jgi:hypothetical protein
MDKLPFSVYDFFGYLASGFVLLVAIAVAFVGYEPLTAQPPLLIGLLLIVAAYVTGHVIANLSGDLLERRLVRKRLNMPTAILMGADVPKWARWLFPGYASALPAAVQARIAARAKRAGVEDRGEGLFFHCHAVLKHDSVVQARLNTFLNLYGFCRNMALALLLAAVVLSAGLIRGTADTGPDVAPGVWLVAALVAALALFYRYLKFLRQFGVELLTSYAEVNHESR